MRLSDRVRDYGTAVAATLASVLPRRRRQRLDPATGVPVLLVPGVWENPHYLAGVARWLDESGYATHVVPGLGWNLASLAESARRVGAELDRLQLGEVLLVAHSKGGLIAKQVMLDRIEDGTILGCVALATPFGGSRLANLMPPGLGLRSLRPRDRAITTLQANLEINARIVSIYARHDPHVPEGSRLAGAAENIEIDTSGHFRVLDHPQARGAILRSLRRLAERRVG